MGLDIRFTMREKTICPHCGEVIGHKELNTFDSCGRAWYPILKKIGYYVPYEQRTEENDWYGKDMVLSNEQANDVYQWLKKHDVYDGDHIKVLISSALYEGADIVINADW